MGGGVEPRYNVSSNVPPNVPPNALCILTLKDNSTIYITGENTFNMEDIYPYHEDIVSAIITNRCTFINDGGFLGCIYLSSVIIPDSVTAIGQTTFLQCQSLSSVTLPNNITKIDRSTFQGCKSLEHITLPNTLKELGYYAFYGSGLKELVIPEGVTKIKGQSINSCHNLESVTFPSSVEEYPFLNFLNECEKLREIKIIGTKDITNIFPFGGIENKSDLTLYVDSSLVDAYKAKRDRVNGQYKVLPLE